MRRPLRAVPLFALVAACGGAPAPSPSTPAPAAPTMSSAPPPAPADPHAATPTWDTDPVPQGLTAAGLRAICDRHLGRARALLDGVKALAGAPDAALTVESVLLPVDRIGHEVAVAAGFPELMSVAHPEEGVRDAGKDCRPKATEFYTELMLDPVFAKVVQRFAETKPALTGTRQRLLADLLRDLKRNGLMLPPEGQARLRELNDQLSKLSQDFETHLSDAVGKIRVDPARLKGLPQPFLDGHPPGPDGKIELTTNYPDYFPVLQYCQDRTVAKELNLLFDTRAAEQNLPVLDQVLALRREKAKLLGYESWAAYAIEPRMAKTPAAVREFLAKAAAVVKAPARREYAEFSREHVAALKSDPRAPLPTYDRAFLEERLREKKYGFDSKKLSEYFEVKAVTEGLLGLYAELFGLTFTDDPDAPRWHPDVRALRVTDASSQALVGRIYLDLYPRDGKFKHAAMFEIRPGVRVDGHWSTPISALVCNFPQPGGAGPALLTHGDVTTYFHEFGHALHHVLTREELASYSGTNTARDFVETPSQMLEEWTFRRETLDRFARHYQTGEKIPEPLFQAMTRARSFGRALGTERQIALATLDFEYHARTERFDTDQVLDEVMQKTQSFAFQPGTHFQATFGHLMGYDAGYYGYQWALAMARDVLTRFDKEGYMNPTTAAAWRDTVLARGAGADERDLVRQFLGREPNLDAYGAFLSGK